MAVDQTEEVFAAHFFGAILRYSEIYLGRLRAFHKKIQKKKQRRQCESGVNTLSLAFLSIALLH